MNYRHGFHAGNFADLVKHAACLHFLRLLRQEDTPVEIIDTHAGAGFYDLSDPLFARSKEAEAGIKYLLSHDVPPSLKPLADYVWAKNHGLGFKDRLGLYPGSPLLLCDHLRPQDHYVGCELREDDFGWLRHRLGGRGDVFQTDGYQKAIELCRAGLEVAEAEPEAPNAFQVEAQKRRFFFLIDPPFEKFEDYDLIVETVSEILEMRPEAQALIWLPLKDLETFDRFMRHLEQALFKDEAEDIQTPTPLPIVSVGELRLRGLMNPMKMNGCVLVAINPPEGFVEGFAPLIEAVASVFGEASAKAKVWSL